MNPQLLSRLARALGTGVIMAGIVVAGICPAGATPPDDAGTATLDPVTGLVGLDSHDHPWDEQPPPIVDLGEVVPID